MAIEPTIASAPRLAPIPILGKSMAAIDGATTLVDAIGNAALSGQQTQRKVEQIDFETQQRARQQAEATEASAGQVSMLQAFGAARQTLQDSRNDPAATLDDHVRLTAETAATVRQQALAAFPSERVRQHFAPQIEQDVQSLVAGEDGWRRGQEAKMQGDAGDAVMNAGTASIFSSPTPATFEAEHRRIMTFMDALPMNPVTRAKVVREVDAKTLRALSDGLIAKGDYAGARTLAGTQQFGAIFGAEGVKLTMAQADQGEAAAAAAARAQAAAVKKAADDALDAQAAIIDEGGIVPDATLRSVAAQAQAAGVDPAKIVHFQGLAVTQALNRQFGAAADPDGSKTRAALSELTHIAQSRPLTSDENVRYDRLLKLTGTRRVSDAEALKPLFGKTVAGDVQGLQQLDQLPQADRFDVAERIKPGLAYVQLLSGHDRNDAVQGQFDLRANPDLIKVPGHGGKVDRFTPEFRTHLGAMAFEMSDSAIKGYQQAAEGIYATYLKNEGRTGWQPDLFIRAANVAMGARRGTDGRWYGGLGQVNGQHVMLPDWGTADALTTALSRADFGRARYADGTTADKADILAHYAPVLVSGGDGRQPADYMFRSPSGKFLKADNGSDFKLTARPGGIAVTSRAVDQFVVGKPAGLVAAGNIDLHARPVVHNKDGSISTVRSISIGTDQGEVLIPTVSPDGKILSDHDAIALYERTGRHLGIFRDPATATAYAKSLHAAQANEYLGGGR